MHAVMPSLPASLYVCLVPTLQQTLPPSSTHTHPPSSNDQRPTVNGPSSIRPFFPLGHPYLMIRCRPSNAGLRHSRKKGCHPESAPTRPLPRPPSLGLLVLVSWTNTTSMHPPHDQSTLQPSATTYRTLPHISFSYHCAISRTDI